MVNGKYSGLSIFNYIRNKYWLKLYFVSNLRVTLRALVSPSYKILKFKETITMYKHSNKTNINIFGRRAPNRIPKRGNFKLWFCRILQRTRNCCKIHAERAARLFFPVQPIRFLIHGVIVAVDVVDAEAYKYPIWCFVLSKIILLSLQPLSFHRPDESLF